MPRDSSPAELSPLERTARWVEAQAGQTYEQPRPPSPRPSVQTSSSSYRTTSSSSDSYSKSPLAPPIITAFAMPAAHVPHITQRPRYDSRSRRASLPFPQSPPGSGYPVPLEVVTPRKDAVEDNQTPRPSLRKQRRPSLIEQIISLGVPTQRRSSREESVRRGQT